MVDIKDKETCFPRTFNEQMAWIGEEVEHIIKHDATRQTKQKIRQQGREAYGQVSYTHAIKRMFDIIKADPKNRALMREVDRAEQELTAFLYDEPGTLPEEEIFAYWNNYLWAYTAELESHRIHYFIVRGYVNFMTAMNESAYTRPGIRPGTPTGRRRDGWKRSIRKSPTSSRGRMKKSWSILSTRPQGNGAMTLTRS